MVSVLFLCLGNICRSPMAEAVFRRQVEAAGLQEQIEIDSAGLGDWHAGKRPHRGTIEVLDKHGVSHAGIHSRQIVKSDIAKFDYIVAMDAENMEGLRKLGAVAGDKVFRLLELAEARTEKNVPDPYYTGNFDEVYEMVTEACLALLEKVRREHGLEPTVVTRDEMKLVGIVWSGAYADAKEIPALWVDFMARAGEIAGRVKPTEYISPCHGRKTEFTCYITAEVEDFAALPSGMKGITVPAQTYVKITHRGPMDQVFATYNRLFTWMADNGHKPNREELWLEVYDERYNSAKDDPGREENEYDIYMPIAE